ncbi:MAG: ATP-binding cassette domain-containing protein [Fibrobacteria bacterium]|nr:ATP-binding cassette domain-containing protein [Fibrobacteria bacterium]
MMARIKVRHLKAGYGKDIILKDVDVTVEEREIRVILGGSGCGKSTLLNNIIGLEQPLGGEINILGQNIDITSGNFSSELRKKTGVLFQSSALLTSMTVAENVGLPLQIHNPQIPAKVLEEIVKQKLSQVHMVHAFNKYPSELSGGMKKRAALARAMINDPSILFCDEPSAGLDPLSSKSLDELLLELRDKLGLSIVIVTHELDSIRAICDKLTFLADGYVLFDGSLEEALKSGPEEVKNFFARKTVEDKSKVETISFNLEG